jgi:hypothetical protein
VIAKETPLIRRESPSVITSKKNSHIPCRPNYYTNKQLLLHERVVKYTTTQYKFTYFNEPKRKTKHYMFNNTKEAK